MYGDDRDIHDLDQSTQDDDAAELGGQLDDDAGDEDADDLGDAGQDPGDQSDRGGGAEGEVRGQGRLPPVEGQAPKGPGKRELEMIRLRKRAQEAERKAQAAEQKAEEALQAVQNRQQQESAEQRAARLAGMSDWERSEYLQNETRQYVERELGKLQFQTATTRDEANFKAACVRNPQLDKIADEVEAEHDRLVGLGRPTERMVIAQWLIGKSVLERGSQAKGRQAARGAERIAAQTTRPGNPRGTQAGQRTRGGESLEDRLRGKTI